MRRISAAASEISLGNMTGDDLPVRGRDEIASLGELFNRMRRSLANAMKLLEQLNAHPAGEPMSAEPERIGRYRIERVLGRGAMGVVYRAHDPDIDRLVAIKLIRADLLDEAGRADYMLRFRREAQAAGRCSHPNIVTIYDFATHEGNPFLAMELVDGLNLSQARDRGAVSRPEDAVRVVLQVLDALGAAHALGIVHRDIKPTNILLVDGNRVKVTDFGICRLEGSALTQDGSVIGTPSYMSPEQCRGDPVDQRSDLFSTGAVLYELLCGERPFAGRNFTEVARRLLFEAPPDIRARNAAVTAAMASVLERALAKPPAERFASAADMAVALQAAMAQSPATSGGPVTTGDPATGGTTVVAPAPATVRPAGVDNETQGHAGAPARPPCRADRALSRAERGQQMRHPGDAVRLAGRPYRAAGGTRGLPGGGVASVAGQHDPYGPGCAAAARHRAGGTGAGATGAGALHRPAGAGSGQPRRRSGHLARGSAAASVAAYRPGLRPPGVPRAPPAIAGRPRHDAFAEPTPSLSRPVPSTHFRRNGRTPENDREPECSRLLDGHVTGAIDSAPVTHRTFAASRRA